MQIVIDDEKIIDLLETEWGYEGIRKDVRRLLIKNGIPLSKALKQDPKTGHWIDKGSGQILTTYQIYLILLGSLVEHNDVGMLKLMLAELYKRAEREEKQIPKSPCDACKYNPPGSGDGKPCSMCPAEGRGEE